MMSRAWSAIPAMLAILALVLVSACEETMPEQTPQTAAGDKSSTVLHRDELALLDQLTTLETIFPDASDRAIYTANDPVIEDGKRNYTFVLKSQPGMDPSRHFRIITVTWARGGTLAKSGATSPGMSGTGGPDGGFVEAIAQTADRAYDIRVAQGELLPNTAKAADVDIEKLAQSLTGKYTDVKVRR